LDDAVFRKRQRLPLMEFQKRNAHFMEVNLLIERARKLAGTEEKPGNVTKRQLEDIQRNSEKKLRKLNRTEQ
jgi:hypothetical protein